MVMQITKALIPQSLIDEMLQAGPEDEFREFEMFLAQNMVEKTRAMIEMLQNDQDKIEAKSKRTKKDEEELRKIHKEKWEYLIILTGITGEMGGFDDLEE